jgi:hypothetical protein
VSGKPAYFEPIRLKAARRWEQLESDPELAGPWHQLFKQVQSPRHVLSELLQNADDAGATEATVRIADNTFEFAHNGEDFIEEHFASLCRFGYSNKRALHTIGFRGIGFKSTFSLGDRVELYSPTLAVSFLRARFTEPVWSSQRPRNDGRTHVRVAIGDLHRQREVEKNLDDWVTSPVSLLFFKHIRRLQVGDRAVHWSSVGTGPVAGSEWMALDGQKGQQFLVVRSAEEAFPPEALTEIKHERMVGNDIEASFPPCKVEIVLGVKGRLYVVLPTGVDTELPFACNAPLMQDPARLKIKDPETSPTNRWLLERAGKLAASTMIAWLDESGLPVSDRARAYGLLPDVDREATSLEGICGTAVEEAFAAAIEGRAFLLTHDGKLTGAKRSVAFPKAIFDVWPAEQAAAMLDDERRPALSDFIAAEDGRKLARWGLIDEVNRQSILTTLQTKHLPKPDSWRKLLNLWDYVAPEITAYRHYVTAKEVRIIPVQGKGVLYSAKEVVRLSEKKLLQSEDDWEFLSRHLLVLNRNWLRFVADQRRAAENEENIRDAVGSAYAVLEKLGLDETSDLDTVIDLVAAEFFSRESVQLGDAVRLTQIAAKLGATVGECFRFITRDMHLRSPDAVLIDDNGELEYLLPEDLRDAQLLHAKYTSTFSSCSQDEWQRWVAGARARLLAFIPLSKQRHHIYSRKQLEKEARRRGLRSELSFVYVTDQFVVEDWDFDKVYWDYWSTLAVGDEHIWADIVDRVLSQRDAYWMPARAARLLQVATTGSTKSITYETLRPSWLLRLSELPCLPDTRGFRRKPSDLLRRTPETESLLDVEFFVDARLDGESTRAVLDLLGVRSTPTGPARILDCIRALARAQNPPFHEVEKWFRRLDQMATSSTADFQAIRHAFQSEALVLTQEGTWAKAAAVFLAADEESAPGAAIVRATVQDLTLWRKIGIAERPTPELAIGWLQGLPAGQVPSQEELRRLRALLVRYPVRIWQECGHWLNLRGEWSPVESLSYVLTMQSLVPWRDLHEWVKQKTADLQRLPGEVTSSPPFNALRPLAEHVEDRFNRDLLFVGPTEKHAWLAALGMELRRVELETESETERIRALADALANTSWRSAPRLEVIPYIDGTPAGTPRRADVIWIEHILYVDGSSKAKLARRVPEEISKTFGRADIKAALDYGFERSPEDVSAYVEENFKLIPKEALQPTEYDGLGGPQTSDKSDATQQSDGASVIAQVRSENGAVSFAEAEESEEEQAADDQAVRGGAYEAAERSRPSFKSPRPSIMERFARLHGFRKDGDARFYHEDGSWISRTHEEPFPWERRSDSGELVRSYRPDNHCLEHGPLHIESDAWGLIEQFPDAYALILADSKGDPVEVTGTRLRAMRSLGHITLYPATYRIVFNDEKS